jgi:hypothetical protein
LAVDLAARLHIPSLGKEKISEGKNVRKLFVALTVFLARLPIFLTPSPLPESTRSPISVLHPK